VRWARLIEGDYHQHSLEPYDCMFLFPDKRISPALQQKLLEEAGGAKLIVQGHVWQPTFFERERTHEINGTVFHEYRL
jgi:hypothetical protein